MLPRVSVVAPFYNEAGNPAPLYMAIVKALEGSTQEFECVFVDDGSSDGTGVELERLARQDPRLRPLFLRENRGQSAALMAGLRQARGEFLVTLDGDLQNDPADIPRVLELLQDYDCVCGVRVNRRDTWLRRVSSRVANAVRNAVLHDGIRDTGCGIKGFRRACVEHLPCFNGVHRFFAVFVRRAGLTITECPVKHHPRRHGKSKYGVHNRLWRGLYDLIGVAWLRRRYVTYKLDPRPAALCSTPLDPRPSEAPMPEEVQRG